MCTYVYMHTCIHTHIYIYICVCVCVDMYIYIYICHSSPPQPCCDLPKFPSRSSQGRSELRCGLSGNIHLPKHAALHILGKGRRGFRVYGSLWVHNAPRFIPRCPSTHQRRNIPYGQTKDPSTWSTGHALRGTVLFGFMACLEALANYIEACALPE